jgi:hypothetical protein
MAKTTRGEIKVVGTSGQVSLGKRYAGRTFELERLEGGTLVLRPVALVPENELWTVQERARSEVGEGPAPDWVADWLRHRIPPASGATAREILEQGRGRLAPRAARKPAKARRPARPHHKRGGGADR